MSPFDFSEAALDRLRDEIRASLSEYRFRHIAEVEKTIARLGALYLPNDIPMLRASALLHDLTKEFSTIKQEEILSSHGILITDEDRRSPKLYHAVTAALLIPERYPSFATPELVRAVRYHTTGCANMPVADLLLYLADYIDESRTFDDCVRLRHYFRDKNPEQLGHRERLAHLYDTVILSVDMTVAALNREGAPVSEDSLRMREDLMRRKAELF